MTLTNIVINAKPPQVQGFYLLSQKPTTVTLYQGQKYATINVSASAIFVSVGTTISPLHVMSGPVYTTHSASKTSEHVKGVGQPAGVGHGAGDINALSEHPHFLHPQEVQVLVAIV